VSTSNINTVNKYPNMTVNYKTLNLFSTSVPPIEPGNDGKIDIFGLCSKPPAHTKQIKN
jgi:hypothetical protein